ncbi:MAG: glycoside hydrolase family 3 C-terminal domain-containing protein [Deferribacteres bacterium]|nr:glycoside hydrolase family 3 C-terminal domain-containing protein [Deferribacteres bacterium]
MKNYIQMITLSVILSITIALIYSSCTNQAKVPSLNVDEVIASLTLEEKAMLVVGTGMVSPFPDSIAAKIFGDGPNPFNSKIDADSAYVAMVEKLNKIVPGSAGRTAIIPEDGVTTMVLADGPAGLRINPHRKNDSTSYFATAFPIATALASTWNTELVEEVGKAMGNEVLEYGVDVILGPGLNLQRNPLCGRNFEYYSEDPLVTGKMAAAMVNGIQSNGVGTSIKHFAANNQETNRLTSNTVVSERALRELYLKSFRIAVQETQPWTVMSSYNKINGTYASESHDLLTKVLRDDWQFKGYVMTDWTAGNDRVAQMRAGNDLLMPGDPEQMEALIAAVENGKLDESVLDTNLKRILNVMVKSPTFQKYQNSNKPNLQKSAESARKAGSEGMVLLKNNSNTLPFGETVKTVAAFGIGAYNTIIGGTGSGDVNDAYKVSFAEGLQKANYNVLGSLEELYADYLAKNKAPDLGLLSLIKGTPRTPEMMVSTEMVRKTVAESDIALVAISRNSGEGGDRKAEQGDFYLTDREKSIISTVATIYHKNAKKVVVVLNIGGVIETSSWSEQPDAILVSWQPGQEAGNSLADVLSGTVNPSGRLAVSFPKSYSDVPSAISFPGYELVGVESELKSRDDDILFPKVPWEIVYEDDIYVGYRFYNTFDVPVEYEFGYGLSYTSFEFADLKTSSDEFGDDFEVSVTVKNTGNEAGKEVVQLYIAGPQTKLEKPNEELRGFAKTNELKPGESQTIAIKLKSMDLASFDETTSSWIVEPGDYQIKIGSSSKKIGQTASFKVADEIVVQKVSKALIPQVEFKKLSRK